MRPSWTAATASDDHRQLGLATVLTSDIRRRANRSGLQGSATEANATFDTRAAGVERGAVALRPPCFKGKLRRWWRFQGWHRKRFRFGRDRVRGRGRYRFRIRYRLWVRRDSIHREPRSPGAGNHGLPPAQLSSPEYPAPTSPKHGARLAPILDMETYRRSTLVGFQYVSMSGS